MKKAVKIVLIVLAAIVVLCAAAIAVFYLRINNPENVFANLNSTPAPVEIAGKATAEPTQTPDAGETGSTETADPTPEPTPDTLSEAELESMADLSFMENRVNILVMGIDRSAERLESNSFRSDTIILVTVNFKTGDVDMISFPRDSYVKLYDKKGELIDPDDPYNKINEAFSRGGMMTKGGYQSEMNTVSALLGGIPINYYVSFDMTAVKEIVNAMGGVDYDVDVEVRMNGRELHVGYQHLDGQGVLDYCRQRKGSSDTARADRQQRMLKAIFNQMKSTGQIANIPKIYKAVADCIETDLSFEQICSLSLVAVRMDTDQLDRHMIQGRFESLYSRDVWLVDREKLIELIKEVFDTNANIPEDVDGDYIMAAAEENRLAVQNELAAANALYSEAKAVISSYSSALSSETLNALNSIKGNLATAIRRENKTHLDTYSQSMSAALSAAYAELGISSSGVYSDNSSGSGTGAEGWSVSGFDDADWDED